MASLHLRFSLSLAPSPSHFHGNHFAYIIDEWDLINIVYKKAIKIFTLERNAISYTRRRRQNAKSNWIYLLKKKIERDWVTRRDILYKCALREPQKEEEKLMEKNTEVDFVRKTINLNFILFFLSAAERNK